MKKKKALLEEILKEARELQQKVNQLENKIALLSLVDDGVYKL